MRLFAWGAFLCGSMAVVCSAQDTIRSVAPVFVGGGFWGAGRHASTAAEGAARGMADVIRSRGAANLLNSEAAVNYEEARRRYINNRLKATNAYFEMKRINREARAETRPQPPTQEQLIRIAKAQLPDRPTASQLDPLTGGIQWPLALRSNVFAPARERLEKLYAERAEDGSLSPEEYLQVKDTTDAMIDVLRRNRSLPGNLTIEARKFLEGLAYEAQFQAG